MTKYKCLEKQHYFNNDYSIAPLREADIFLIKKWRNEQMDILRQAQEISDIEQQQYYDNVIAKLFVQDQPQQLLFSFFCKNILIGYGGLVYIKWHDKRAEVSFLLDTEYVLSNDKYKVDFLNFLELMKQLSFKSLDLNRLFTETYDIRDHHISCLESSGFVLEGVLKEHVIIDTTPTDALIHGYLKKYYHEK
jgi:RimJ/RimL family protein N-acetyltransferase